MQAIVYDRFGDAEVLELRDIPSPTPAAGEVLIDVHYAAVNPIDWKLRLGLYEALLQFSFPVVPGWDVAGVVGKTGSEVTTLKPGDRVYAMAVSQPIGKGTYAEQTVASESVVARIPDSLSFRDAAGIPLATTAAHDALFRIGQVKSGQRILIHQGAGGVGILAIQLARLEGAYIYSTCSTGNVDYVKSLGADRVIDYSSEDFAAVIAENEPDGLDFVLDGVGGETFALSHEVVKPGGILVTMGDFPDQARADERAIRTAFLDSTARGAMLDEVGAHIEAGRISLPEIQEMPLADAAAAQTLSQGGHVRGKIVLKVK